MAPLSLRIVQDNGTVTRKIKLDPAITVREAHAIVREKSNMKDDTDYGLFLKSNENEVAGIWMEDHRTLGYYMLRDGDRIDYLKKTRNLRIKMLDDSAKTLQVDQSKIVCDLMISICSRLGITNHEEYGLCLDDEETGQVPREAKGAGLTGTLTLTKKSQLKERDLQFEQMRKKLKTDDDVEWIDAHKTLSEAGVAPERTVVLKRRLFYSDRNVDARDPVQLNLLYVQVRDNILNGRHPVTEAQAADCKVRWINIRDVHRRIIRKSMSGHSRPKSAYKYDSLMEFMKDYYREVVAANSMSEEEAAQEEQQAQEDQGAQEHDDDDDKNSEAWQDVVLECSNASEDEEDEKPIKRKKLKRSSKSRLKKVNKFEEVDVSTASTVNETCALSTEYDVSDPVDAFLLSIGATLKKFSPYHLNLAKSKIFHIVQEHDLQQIVEKQQGRLECAISTSSEPVYFQG